MWAKWAAPDNHTKLTAHSRGSRPYQRFLPVTPVGVERYHSQGRTSKLFFSLSCDRVKRAEARRPSVLALLFSAKFLPASKEDRGDRSRGIRQGYRFSRPALWFYRERVGGQAGQRQCQPPTGTRSLFWLRHVRRPFVIVSVWQSVWVSIALAICLAGWLSGWLLCPCPYTYGPEFKSKSCVHVFCADLIYGSCLEVATAICCKKHYELVVLVCLALEKLP